MRRAHLSLISVLLASLARSQWQAVDTSVQVTALFSVGDTLIWGTNEGVVRWSDDQGQTWSDISGTLPSGYVDNIGQGAGERLFCTVGSLVFRSDAPGTWEGAASLGASATCMAFDDSLILAGAEFSGGLERSADNGMSWYPVGQPITSSYLTSVATDGNTIWASRFGGDAMSSSDGGATWAAISGLEGINVFSLFNSEGLFAGDDSNIHCPGSPWSTAQVGAQILDIERSDAYLAACGTFPGVFVSADYCGTWQAIEAGYTTFQINAIAFIGTVVYAGNTDGLWKLDLDIWSGIPGAMESRRALLWPNPTREEFSFSLAEGGQGPVRVEIFDASGRVVHRSSLPPALRSVSVSGLPPGRYMARFVTEKSAATSALVIDH